MTHSSQERSPALSRRHFLAGTSTAAAALALGRHARAETGGSPRHLIVVLASGGWDSSYALDPKPGNPNVDSPPGDIELFADIPVFTDPSRPSARAFFDQWAPYTAVINGINVRSIAHPECRRRVLTGTAGAGNPDLAAMAAFELAPELPVPYLILGDNAYTGPLAAAAGRVGRTNQIKALLDPSDRYPAPAGSPFAHGGYLPDSGDEALIREYVLARAERVRAQRGQLGYNRARIDDFTAALQRGDVLKTQADGFGDRGTTLSFDAQVDMAIRVLTEGISRAVNIDSRLGWDTHQGNAPQGIMQEVLFAGLSRMAQELADAPGVLGGSTLLDETTVLVISEMTRTPKLNGAGGKDHWPVASAMLLGAGVAGGRSYGGTNDLVEAEPVDLTTGDVDPDGVSLQTGNLAAGVLQVVGADPSLYFPNQEPFGAICT